MRRKRKRKEKKLADKLRYGTEFPCCGRCKHRDKIHTGARPAYQCKLTGDYYLSDGMCPSFQYDPKAVPAVPVEKALFK